MVYFIYGINEFVKHFISHSLDHRSIRGLVHKLEESEIMDAKKYYYLGLQSEVYPFQDMDVENRIIVRSYYSHYEMKVIFNEVFKKILGVISEQEVTRLFRALILAKTDQEVEETGIKRIAFNVCIEKLPSPSKTNLHFLDRFDMLNLDQVNLIPNLN